MLFLKKYDRVVSDNLPEILEHRNDAILSGHFFWHEFSSNVSKNYKLFAENLINEFKPVVIASQMFASHTIKSNPRYIPTGLYAFQPQCFRQKVKKNYKNSCLISPGSTIIIRDRISQLVNKINTFIAQKKGKLFIDPSIYHKIKKNLSLEDPLQNIYQATYTLNMYKQIRVAIVRPGLGTITDLLLNKAFPICFYESSNLEMQNNAKILDDSKLGIDLNSKNKSYSLEEIFYHSWEQTLFNSDSTAKINFSGADEAARQILY